MQFLVQLKIQSRRKCEMNKKEVDARKKEREKQKNKYILLLDIFTVLQRMN